MKCNVGQKKMKFPFFVEYKLLALKLNVESVFRESRELVFVCDINC